MKNQMAVVCDTQNERLGQFANKYQAFMETLDADETAYMNFITYAADVAFAEHGAELTEEAVLNGGNVAFEEEISQAMGDSYVPPQMTTAACVIRTTVKFKCATWLLKC